MTVLTFQFQSNIGPDPPNKSNKIAALLSDNGIAFEGVTVNHESGICQIECDEASADAVRAVMVQVPQYIGEA